MCHQHHLLISVNFPIETLLKTSKIFHLALGRESGKTPQHRKAVLGCHLVFMCGTAHNMH